jgi:hypothetical protein
MESNRSECSGFTGDTCEACGKTVNLQTAEFWFCEDENCKHYNLTNYDYLNIPFDKPDFGPTFDEIRVLRPCMADVKPRAAKSY